VAKRFLPCVDVPKGRLERMPGDFSIYALVDPRDATVRYIGYTRQWPLENRLKLHLSAPTNARMRLWFVDLGDHRPLIQLLGHCAPGTWAKAEKAWIAWVLERGKLLNYHKGGRLYLRGRVTTKPLPARVGDDPHNKYAALGSRYRWDGRAWVLRDAFL
jgi:hypothetical protein